MLIEKFINRPLFTTMLVLTFVILGIFAYPKLGLEREPAVEWPLITISVAYKGASPEEVESLVTKLIEDEVSSVQGIKNISSRSKEGLSSVVLEFNYGTDLNYVINEVREKLTRIKSSLPKECDDPIIAKENNTSDAVVSFSLSSDSRSREEIRKVASDIIKDVLQRIDGIAEVTIAGGSEREIHVLLDFKKLEAYGISPQQIIDVLNNQNVNMPGGILTVNDTELSLRTLSKYENLEDLRNIVIVKEKLVRLKDVALIEDGWTTERVYTRTNGNPCVIVEVKKQFGANTVKVVEQAKSAVSEMQKNALPADIQVLLLGDDSKVINDSVNDLMLSLIMGGISAVLVTFLFLGSIRATLIGAIAVPASIIATFFAMKFMNFTLNMMSLLGLSLVIGILIDDAVVVLENIYRYKEQQSSALLAARDGTKEIALAVMATTFTLLAVFVPIGSMGETVFGQFFRQFGLTVAFAVAFSLFVAFTLTPALAAQWLGDSNTGNKGYFSLRNIIQGKWERGFAKVKEIYISILKWALSRPVKVIALALVSLLITGMVVQFVGVEFMPYSDTGYFKIYLSAPSGTSLEKMIELVTPVEQEVLTIPELESSNLTVGRSQQVNDALISVKLVPAGERDRSLSSIKDELRVKFRNVEALRVSFSNSQGQSQPIQIGLRGADGEILKKLAEQLAEEIKKIPGAADVEVNSKDIKPEIMIRVNTKKIGNMGLDANVVGNTVKLAYSGVLTDKKYTDEGHDYDIRIKLKPEEGASIKDVANLRVALPNNSFVRLGEIADISMSSGPTEIQRESRQCQVVVGASTVSGVSSGEVLKKIKPILNRLNLPIGYSYELVGETKKGEDMFSEIGDALLLAIILIYMVLVVEFESFVYPFTIMLSLPFSLIGAILALFITDKTLNMYSLIGIVMLMGLVTKNAILLVDYTNKLIEKGIPVENALLTAGGVRLRPILMTTSAMIVGMLPVTFGFGEGGEVRSCMGIALVGGLITSTFLTLVIIPAVYLLLEKARLFWRKWWGSYKLNKEVNG